MNSTVCSDHKLYSHLYKYIHMYICIHRNETEIMSLGGNKKFNYNYNMYIYSDSVAYDKTFTYHHQLVTLL